MLAIPNTHRDQQFQPFPRKDPQAVSSVCLWGFLSSTTVRNACCTIHGHLFCLQFGHMTRLGIVAAICISHCFTSFFLLVLLLPVWRRILAVVLVVGLLAAIGRVVRLGRR